MLVLYNPWSTPSAKKPLPMSLLAIASAVEAPCHIVDGNLVADPVDTIVDLARRTRVTAIGVTVMPGPQLARAVPDCRRLKAALPQVPIVWGGYFPSLHADACLRSPFVDFCVRGQGERTFRELMGALAHGGALSSIAGLSYRENGAIRHTAQRPLTPLDELPDWPYELVPMDRYFHRHYLGSRVGTHHSSYGCPFACTFCAVVDIAGQRWVAQSPERVARIVRLQRERYGADAIQFHDMDFFISEARAAEIARRMTGLDMSWWALGRVDELMRYSDATWRALAASGLKMVFCGAESGSDATLRRMNKGGTATASLTLELAARMKAFGVVPEFSFVVGNPPDPEQDVEDTIRFVRRLKAINPASEIILYTYTPVPRRGQDQDDVAFPETLDEWLTSRWRRFALRRRPDLPWLRARVTRRLRNFESVLNAYHPTVTDRRLTGVRRALLRALGGWRYGLEIYVLPLELRAFHRVFGYQRPETTGF